MSFSVLEEKMLSDIVNFYNGKKRHEDNGDIPVYGGNGILDYCNDFNTEGESIIIGRVGAYCGNVNYTNKRCWISDNAILVKAKDKFDSKFIYYNLIYQDLHNLRTGSSQPLLTQGSLKKVQIRCPILKEQKAIAHILSTLDEKIELNNKINKTLENMAQSIFKEWFVDFEFPNEEGEPYKSSGGEMIESEQGLIPKGWEVSKVSNVTKIVRGASPRPIQDFLVKKGIPWVKISDATSSNNRFISNTNECIKEEGRYKSREVSIGTLILSNSATPGIPKIMKINACVHDGWLIFDNYSGVTREYMYQFLVHQREGILSLSNGSVFRNLKTDILKNYKIIVPSDIIINKASCIWNNINTMIDNIDSQTKKLTEIRDSLLPKLMSGEIRVPF
ncbi:MAG: restriction endonuclease subunit S [Proteocatella sp.]